ncbi:hypothetical protein A6V39_00270 [Candidatus Mycoplasma haematobovis]|uniref:Uncharacterized protein n=1 Tax=Candidatus Mycoplasma haematobovis TaxID=432608 RepID=A0A1A9QEC7_9MOLU|nr:hypothetical protein [Candidatus Mycoplasma haematobovis]OAL10484.1 hypothetical protein A6V39_00270 [Candidatus Mycoplasma haematobovis]
MTTKLIISTIAGISTLGGASVGCYYCFKSKAPESSQSTGNQDTEAQTQKTERIDTPVEPQGPLPATTSLPAPREGQDPVVTQPPLQGSPEAGARGETGPSGPTA